MQLFVTEAMSNFWVKFSYDNGGSAEKKRENAGISLKKKRPLPAFFRILAVVTGISWRISGITAIS